VRRLLSTLAVLLAACQQAAAPADNAAANAGAQAPSIADAAPVAASPDPAPEPASIPANFRGLWAESQVACGQLSHPSRLVISGDAVRYPSFVLSSESVDLPGDNSVAVKGRNETTKAAAEAHFSMDATGSILTDEAGGGAVRVRCG
jgi:hypothetical protein